MSEMKTAITVDDVAQALRQCGYRATVAEQDGYPQVQSAAQGIGFFIRLGNPVPETPGRYVDFSFHCWLTIEGELPPQLIDGWNQGKRFARLFRQGSLLVLTMDVMAAGGVSDGFLRAQAELWDRVIHDFIAHLKRPGGASDPGLASA